MREIAYGELKIALPYDMTWLESTFDALDTPSDPSLLVCFLLVSLSNCGQVISAMWAMKTM